MALRTNAGTGVLVALVVFILVSIFLLILSIVIYGRYTTERENNVEANNALGVYVDTASRNNDSVKLMEAAAKSQRKTVTAYLNGKSADVMQYVDGDPNTTLDELKKKMVGLNPGTQSLRLKMQEIERSRSNTQNELDSTKTQLTDMQAQVEQGRDDAAAAKAAHDQEMQQVSGRIDGYRKAGDRYVTEVQQLAVSLEDDKERYRNRYTGDIEDLEDETDNLRDENARLLSRLKELEARVLEARVTSQDPAMLVDGQIIDTAGNDMVFLDRGKNDRIVLGMNFEVYDDPSAIRVDPRTGEVARGKGSIQVTKVGDTTSTARITRATRGHPIVRNDVLANAIYDPTYQFKFLVHGRFDLDQDGIADSDEEYIRSLINDWGGLSVQATNVPGDLDFLVLGVEPPRPMDLGPNPNQDQMDLYVRQSELVSQYQNLMDQAKQAQIPILNANRLFILTGKSGR
jgi:hypothetical protein